MPSFRPIALLCATVLSLALHLSIPAGPAHANGTPITIVLSYQKALSNFGPENATGVAELVTKEGEVRLTTAGLPQLSGEQYQAWILNSGTGARMALGQFNSSADNVGKLDLVLKDPIPDNGWDTFLVTVEQAGPAPKDPSLRRTIAGRFPLPESGTGAAPKPGELPRTGGPEPATTEVTTGQNYGGLVGIGALLLLIGAAAGYGLGRAKRRTP